MQIRSLTNDEQRFLQDYFGSSVNSLSSFVATFLCAVVILTSLVFLVINGLDAYVFDPLLGPMLITEKSSRFFFSLAIALFFIFREVPSTLSLRNSMHQKLKDILKNNQAEVYNLQIYRAAEFLEFEDEGVGFFLETNEGNTLFLRGQDLYPYASDAEDQEGDDAIDLPYGKIFPSTRMTFVREHTSGCRLNLHSEGDTIASIPKLKAKNFIKRKGKTREYVGPEDGQFYQGSLEDVLKEFGVKALS